jgi:membrane protein DedA with SNARE-associated domain
VTRRRAETLCLSGLGLFGLYSLALLPVAPSLVGSHPIELEALRGSTVSLVAGGAFARVGDASLLLALLVPIPALMLADPLLWWAGRIWGPQAADRLLGGRRGRWAERGIRWAERYGAWLIVFNYFQPIPSVVIYAGAGWTGMRLRRFLALDLLGTALWVCVVVGLGYAIGQSAVDVARTIGHYSLYVTIAIVVGIVAVTARRHGRAATDPEPEAD